MNMNIKEIISKNWVTVFLLCVVLIIVLSLGSDIFWSLDNLNSLQTSIGPTAIVAFGMVILLICGVFDLSVGSIMVLCGMVCARLFEIDMPVWMVVVMGLILGAAAGAINGVLVGVLKINALIATIGTMNIFQGAAMLLFAASRKGQAEYQVTIEFPREFVQMGTGKLLGIYYIFWVMIILLIGITIFLRYSPTGRKMYLTGDNREAAKMMGFNIPRLLLLSFVFTGFLCALAGIISVARFEQANRYMGEGINIIVLISCILGGASLLGGRGTAAGALFGVVFMSLVTNMFNLFEVKSTWQNVVVGAILIVVVTLDGYLTIRKQQELGRI